MLSLNIKRLQDEVDVDGYKGQLVYTCHNINKNSGAKYCPSDY